jgi:hypothetical protein
MGAGLLIDIKGLFEEKGTDPIQLGQLVSLLVSASFPHGQAKRRKIDGRSCRRPFWAYD